MHWLERGLIAMVAFLSIGYAGDWIVFLARGKPTTVVAIHHFVEIAWKSGKTEIRDEGVTNQGCTPTVFPLTALTPCWYLRSHSNLIDRI